MTLTVLGAGTIAPMRDRSPAAFLVEVAGRRWLVDLGPGAVRALARRGPGPLAIDGVLLTHRHPDHCADLPAWAFAHRVRCGGSRPLRTWGAEGLSAFLEDLDAAWDGGLQGDRVPLETVELSATGPDIATLPGGTRLRTRPANHRAGALHLRLDLPCGASVAFSGDTGPSEALAELAAGVDLLVAECALREHAEGVLHLWPEALAAIAARARPRLVLVTHLYPEVPPEAPLAALRAVGVPALLAWDGLRLALGPSPRPLPW